MKKSNWKYTVLSVTLAVIAICYVAISTKTKELIWQITGNRAIAMSALGNDVDAAKDMSVFLMSGLDFTELSYATDLTIKKYEEDFPKYFATHYDEFLTLDDGQYGCFDDSGNEEFLGIFSVTNANHAEGFEKKVVALYDMETGECLFQKSFSADIIDIHFLEVADVEYPVLLMTGAFRYVSGIYGTAEMGYITGGEWHKLDLPDGVEGVNYVYEYEEETGILYRTEMIDLGFEVGQEDGEKKEYQWDEELMDFE